MACAQGVGLTVFALAQLSCAEAVLTAPVGSTITVTANPLFIPATNGVSVISAVVVEPAGTLPPDGTVVQFLTTLGNIEPTGKTHSGIARVNLLSDGRSGTATVTAISGASVGTSQPAVRIGAILSARVFVSAVPSRIIDSRTTHVLAQVFDDQGNPVPSVAVIFSIEGNPSTEHLDSAGLPIFTDNNGLAEDVLRTQLSFTAAPKVVTVRATTSNGVTATAPVTIN